MLVELARLAAVLLLLVALPGLLLVNALFPPPRGGLTRLERAYLALASGVLLLMLVGVTLGSLPHGETGWFRTLATGFPFVELGVALLCAGLFAVGVARGAYPRVSRRVTPGPTAGPMRGRGSR